MIEQSHISGVDLFCGVGGLTHGLSSAGIDVKLGVDLDPACRFPLEENNKTKFLQADVSKLEAADVLDAFGDSNITLLAGCAPCQPFSTYSQTKGNRKVHKDWGLLKSFSSLVLAVRPTLVTMENVPPLIKQDIFNDFVKALKNSGYYVDSRIVNGTEIGLPQTRKRLVLIASLLGPIELSEQNMPKVTVRDVIKDLRPIEAGTSDKTDRLHVSASLSPLNLARIRHSKPGGTWRDWPKELVAACHAKDSGSTYSSVYGRMQWEEPSPTITTQCFGFGNGRFGHPEQDRAISLREAAIIQSFPEDYAFVPDNKPVNFNTLGRLIGNAVPVRLGEYIGEQLVQHVGTYESNDSTSR
jgi:DNA (cytosine-5)-methyltransferase 1